jgi:AGZA family xanthine/uracil permease-like MFS transporter
MVTTLSEKATTVPRNAVDRYFKISERGSTIGTEVRGGLVTFFTMCYIIVLNPIILGYVKDGTGHYLGGGTTPHLQLIATATALVAGVMTILMGTVAKFPIAIATGLGLNAVVAYAIASLPGMTWPDAMGIVVLEGVVILILVLTGFRKAIFRAVPPAIKTAISVGIGLFIAFIGLVDSGFVRIPASQATPVELGIGGSLNGWPLLVFVVGLLLAIVLMARKVRGAILIAILSSTVLALIVEGIGKIGSMTDASGKVVKPTGWELNVPHFSGSVVSLPDFSLLGHFSVFGSIGVIGGLAVAVLVFSLVLADFFDTMGTMVAIGTEAGLLDDEGNPEGYEKILVVDAIAAAAGGVGGVSSNTAFIESASGVGDGARTGLASVVTGVAFLLATFLSPLVALVPYEAATPALVVVGFLMVMQVAGIDWKNYEVAIPAFLTIILMPFTYSITAGIGAGFVSYAVIKIAVGKAKEVHPLMWVTAAFFLVYFTLGPIKAALGI